MMVSTMVWERLQEILQISPTVNCAIIMPEKIKDRMIEELQSIYVGNTHGKKGRLFNFPLIVVPSEFDGFMIVRKTY